jgi:uncharacterized protein (TIRG00374 family)
VSLLKLILKLSFAIALVFWMAKKGHLNFDQITQGFSQTRPMTFLTLCVLSSIQINFYRWHVLLKGQGIYLSYRDVIRLSWIGLFFNTALPAGAVGGDVVKSYYIAERCPDKKSASVTTVLVDRLVGFLALIYISCAGLLLNLDFVLATPALLKIAYLMIGCGIALTGVFLMGVSSRVKNLRFFQWVFQKVPLGRALEKTYEAFNAYKKEHKALLRAIGVSLFTHSFSIVGYYFALQTMGGTTVSLSKLSFIVPIGMITTVVPISPAGIGVGQVAFLKLFEWVLGYPTSTGADAFTVFQAALIFLNLCGVVPYMFQAKPKRTTAPTSNSGIVVEGPS